MTVDEYLKKILTISKNHKKTLERLDELDKENPAYAGYTGDHTNEIVQMTKKKDPMAEQLAYLIDLRRELNAEIQRNQKNISNFVKFIEHTLEDRDIKTILTHRYLSTVQWDTIAQMVNYSYSYTLKLHNRGIEELKRVTGDYVSDELVV